MTAKQTVRLAFSISVATLFVWLMARQINPGEFRKAFAGTTPLWIVAGLAAFAAGYSCRIARWHLMLQRDNPSLKWGHCFGPFLASFAVNNVLPFRAGDVLRTFAFNGRLGVSSGVVVATLFVERLLDLLMVLVLLGGVLIISGLDIKGLSGIGNVTLTVISLGVLLFLLYPQLFMPVAVAIGKFVARLAPKLGEALLAEINKSVTTLAHLAKGSTMIRLVLWSLAAWLAEGCVFWFAALALSSITTPAAGWLALPVGTLATLIPSTPGYVGTFDYFTVRAMSVLGNSVVAATAYALLVHALLWLPPTLIGGLYLLLRPSENQIK